MKKFEGLAKSFTLLITVIFLASCLFVGCKEQEPEPTPTPQYMVTYIVDETVNENFESPTLPENGKVDEGTVINPAAPAEVVGWTFDGWYVDDVKVPEAGISITKDTTFVAKFTENVAPEGPADPAPEKPGENEGGNEGGESGDQGGNENGGTEGGESGDQGGNENGGTEGGTTPTPENPGENEGGNEGGETPAPTPTPENPGENEGGNESGTTPAPEPTPDPEPTKYTVTYVTNPADLTVENFPVTGAVEENVTVTLPELALEGYTFDGWFDGETKVDSPYKVTKDVTLTAKFTQVVVPPAVPTYTITNVSSLLSEIGDVYVYAFNNTEKSFLTVDTFKDSCVTFSSETLYDNCIVVVVSKGTNADWSNVIYQTKDLPLNDNVATVDYELDLSGLFLRGDMNSWETENPLVSATDYSWTVDFTASLDSHSFKIADNGWTTNYADFLTLNPSFGISRPLDDASMAGLTAEKSYTMIVVIQWKDKDEKIGIYIKEK